MPLAVLLWLALLQLLSAPSLHRDVAWHEPGAPVASWRGVEQAPPRSWVHRPGPAPALRSAGALRAGAALPAGTVSVSWASVRTELRGPTGLAGDLAPPSRRLVGHFVPHVAGDDRLGRLASHAAEAHGGRLPYFPTAPPLHG